MSIQTLNIRSITGNAINLLEPGVTVPQGLNGLTEIHTDSPVESINVTIDGNPSQIFQWPQDLSLGEHTIVVEQVFSGSVVDRKAIMIQVTGASNS